MGEREPIMRVTLVPDADCWQGNGCNMPLSAAIQNREARQTLDLQPGDVCIGSLICRGLRHMTDHEVRTATELVGGQPGSICDMQFVLIRDPLTAIDYPQAG
jgi:hypothetical protein